MLQVLSFTIGTHRCGIAISAVDGVMAAMRLEPLPSAPACARGLINLRGTAIAVVDLGIRFGDSPSEVRPASRLVLIRTPQRRLALLADSVAGLVELPQSAIATGAALYPGAQAAAGIAAVPEGLLFISDAEALLAPTEELALTRALEEARE